MNNKTYAMLPSKKLHKTVCSSNGRFKGSVSWNRYVGLNISVPPTINFHRNYKACILHKKSSSAWLNFSLLLLIKRNVSFCNQWLSHTGEFGYNHVVYNFSFTLLSIFLTHSQFPTPFSKLFPILQYNYK